MRFPSLLLGIALPLAYAATPACLGGERQCTTTPCPGSSANIFSPCGFQSVTSTCTGFQFLGCKSAPCVVSIHGLKVEACTVTAVLGDGTTQTAALRFEQDYGECCPGLHVAKSPALSIPSTCFADAGVDATPDAPGDAPADVESETSIDP